VPFAQESRADGLSADPLWHVGDRRDRAVGIHAEVAQDLVEEPARRLADDVRRAPAIGSSST
jgi:hypothetical protein